MIPAWVLLTAAYVEQFDGDEIVTIAIVVVMAAVALAIVHRHGGP